KNGALITSTPDMSEKYGTSFAHRDYFTSTIKTGNPVISAPFVAVVNDRPAIMMTALLRAADGSVNGVLCGAV
ncbi:MAG: hypothetical protein J0653_04780, partial [Deltaproteobacteria bacterium]|nr:hypothetical protein [Deltaproteobacteria bacterium]